MNQALDQPVVWIIDRQHWPRSYLRAELLERGIAAVGFARLGPALAALHQPDRPQPGLILLELCELNLRPDELVALARTGIPLIALGGAIELNEETVKNFKWAAVMPRPCTIGDIVEKVEKLVGKR